MAWVEEFEITIPNDTAEGQRVQERIVAKLEELDFPERDVFGVRLALEEALVNAIKHGNGMDEEKTVQIGCWISDDRVRIEIEDEGPGFDPGDVPDPTLDENLERPCGRGLMLIRSFMSRCEYVGRGNKVILEKERAPATTEKTGS
ncbi:ATP-binding protein [Stratiformator vulcanicus]|uniref:Anti-sigma F factor n=1 Tax=Stratiformator vulcanicus TaxID=2527980 RepID=A0A517QY65_9PLAN|nr:ATP-binding protein [Stratiformator vulcanicus]QDT36538.1 Anti-sigma F factor [Stratiformator vulcanicus]